jgi:hypothetical protein
MGVPEGSDLFFGFIGVACALVFASNNFKCKLYKYLLWYIIKNKNAK